MQSEELDKILDDALSSYCGESRIGLEARILNRIYAEKARRRFASWRWAILIPAFACLVLAVISVWVKQGASSKPSIAIQSTAHATIPRVSSERAPVVQRKWYPHQRASVVRYRSMPKLEQFPAPAPLTDQERAFMALLERAPNKARELAAVQDAREVQPLQIKEIQIEPLQSDGQ